MKKSLSRIFILGFILNLSFFAFGQPRMVVSNSVVPWTPAEQAENWNKFENSYMVDSCFRFRLDHLPRKADAVLYDGIVWNAQRGDIALTRVSLVCKSDNSKSVSLIAINAKGVGEIYILKGDKFEKLEQTSWSKPLIEGLIYTPFDVLTPYKFWKWSYIGPGREGMAMHFFELLPDANFAKACPDYSKVVVGLSREFNAPMQTEYFNEKKEATRRVSLSSVKKVQENWIVKQIELLDLKSRDKDKISITHAAFPKAVDMSLFDINKPLVVVDMPEMERL